MIPGQQILNQVLLTRDELNLLGVPEDPKIVGLFEGYGGLTMGVQAAVGGTLVGYAEIEPSSLRLLAEHFPDIPNLGDVSTVDWDAWIGLVDVMIGGFPCQDVSHAGLGKGIMTGTRSGLWYEFARGIAATRPSLVVIENVRGLRSAPAGIKEWNDDDDEAPSSSEPDPWDLGEPGRVDRPVLRALGAVLLDLAELGYSAEVGSIPASAVGAPHGRERVFIIAVPIASRG